MHCADTVLQTLMGKPPDAFYSYFALRFPRLLLTVFFLILRTDSHKEAVFDKYDIAGVDYSGCEAVFMSTLPRQPSPGASLPQVSAWFYKGLPHATACQRR
jgi:hypothetical protein